MVRIITVGSGKGGVGKTTVTANLGITLKLMGKRVVVVDCNLTTAHLGLLFGIYSYPITLNDFLRNDVALENIRYTHFTGLHIVPASLQLKDLVDVDVDDFKNSLKAAFSDYDFVILDSAPGIGREALIALQAADEVLFVATPTIPSLVDVVKCNSLLKSLKGTVPTLGVIVNRVKNKEYEITTNEIRQFTELPIVGIIPEDENVPESANRKSPIVVSKEHSPASQAIFRIATRISGEPTFIPIPSNLYKKPGFFRRILNRVKG